MKNKLIKQPYKGTRDFYPKKMAQQSYLFDTMSMVAEQYGYEEYNASILEETDLYRAKSGDELVNEQTYNFIDRGDREVTIRPEMTPTLARMIAAKRKELVFPLRWYSIPNLFRYERPQRGRLREHWQLNVDIIGVDTQDAEIEIISVANSVMKLFGAVEEDFTIRLNNRKLIDFILKDYLNLSDEESKKTSKLIDRMHKIPSEDFAKALEDIIDKNAEKLLSILKIKNLESLPDEILQSDGAQELKSLIVDLDELKINNYTYDPSLMRGFDYYTGIVFEVFDNHPENSRSLFGGGRYDELVGIFGVESVSAVGFGMGDVTISDFLETHKLLPEYSSAAELKVCIIDESAKLFARDIVNKLREDSFAVVFETVQKKPAQHIKSAEDHAIPFILFIGEDEVKTGKLKLKDLENHEETEVSVDKLSEELRSKL